MLEIDSVPKEQVMEVLKEYNESLIYGAELLVGGADQVKRMLAESWTRRPPSTSWTPWRSTPARCPSRSWRT